MHRHAVLLRELDRAGLEHLGAEARHLEHLVVGDPVELLRLGDDVRVGGVDAVHVGVDLADVGAERGGEGHRREVGAAPAERRDVVLLGHALEARHDRDVAVVEGPPDLVAVDPDDPGPGVRGVGPDPGLLAGERARLVAGGVDRHGEERDGDLLPGGEQHVHLALGRRRGDLLGQADQPVGGLPHGGDDDDDPVPAPWPS